MIGIDSEDGLRKMRQHFFRHAFVGQFPPAATSSRQEPPAFPEASHRRQNPCYTTRMKSKYHMQYETALQQRERRGLKTPFGRPSASAPTEQLSPEAALVTSGAQMLITLCLAQYRPVTLKNEIFST